MYIHFGRAEFGYLESVSASNVVRDLVIAYSRVGGGANREHLPTHHSK